MVSTKSKMAVILAVVLSMLISVFYTTIPQQAHAQTGLDVKKNLALDSDGNYDAEANKGEGKIGNIAYNATIQTMRYNDAEFTVLEDGESVAGHSGKISKKQWKVPIGKSDFDGYHEVENISYSGPINWGTANTSSNANATMAKTKLGKYQLRWSENVLLSNGEKADLIMTVEPTIYVGEFETKDSHDAKIYYGPTPKDDSVLHVRLASGGGAENENGYITFITANPRVDDTMNEKAAVPATTGMLNEVTMKIVKPGTDEPIDSQFDKLLFGVKDLDSVDSRIKTSATLAAKGNGRFSESVELLDGFSDGVWITSDSIVQVRDEENPANQRIAPKGTPEDPKYPNDDAVNDTNTLRSGFITAASPQGFKFAWRGSVSKLHAYDWSELGGFISYSRGMTTRIEPITSLLNPETVKINYVWETAPTPNPETPTGVNEWIKGDEYTLSDKYSIGDKVKDADGDEWVFDGWKLNKDAKEFLENKHSWDVNNDTTIYGYWHKEEIPKTYKIITEVENGTIDPSIENIMEGEDRTINYSPNEGYQLDTITVDGEEVNPNDFPEKYDFTKIDKDHSIKVVYIPAYKIDTEVENGTIDPPVTNIKNGEDRTIKYSPNDGYQLKEIKVDGEDVPIKDFPEKYDFTKIDKDHSIKVVYEKTPKLEIEKVTANGQKQFAPGAEVRYLVTVKQTVDGAEARNVTVKDVLPEGMTMNRDSLAVASADMISEPKAENDTSEGTQETPASQEEVNTQPEEPVLEANAEEPVKEENQAEDTQADVVKAEDTPQDTADVKTDDAAQTGDAEAVKTDDTTTDEEAVPAESSNGEFEIKDVSDSGYEILIPSVKDTFTFTYTAKAPEGEGVSALTNKVTAIGENVPGEPVTDEETISTLPQQPKIVKTVSNPTPVLGEAVTYTITVSEPQEGISIMNAIVKDPFPAGIEYVDGSVTTSGDEATASVENGELTVTIPELANETVIKFHAKVTAKNGSVNNIATLSGDGIEPIQGNAELAVKSPKPTIEKSVSDKEALVGDTVTYTIIVSTDIPLHNAVIKDKVPSGLKIDEESFDCDVEGAYNAIQGNEITVTIPELADGATITYDAEVLKAGTHENVATLTADNFPDGPIQDDAIVKAEKEKTPAKDKDTKDKKDKKDKKSPKTGDSLRYLAIALAAIVALGAIATVVFKRRKNQLK